MAFTAHYIQQTLCVYKWKDDGERKSKKKLIDKVSLPLHPLGTWENFIWGMIVTRTFMCRKFDSDFNDEQKDIYVG